MAGIRLDSDIMGRVGWEYLPKESLKLNVLIMGFDSLSRMTFMRKLPKSYKKLQSLGAIVLEGYNILGDGTPQALIPLLTGTFNHFIFVFFKGSHLTLLTHVFVNAGLFLIL